MLTFPIDKAAKVKEAIMNFIDKCKDKKAAIVGAYRHFCIRGEREVCPTLEVYCALTLTVDTRTRLLLTFSMTGCFLLTILLRSSSSSLTINGFITRTTTKRTKSSLKTLHSWTSFFPTFMIHPALLHRRRTVKLMGHNSLCRRTRRIPLHLVSEKRMLGML